MSDVGRPKSAEQIQREWDTNPRWKDVTRTYTAADVVALQGSVVEEHTLARRGAEVLWAQLHDLEFVNALGALTGNMAVQQVRAGLKAIYLSGGGVAAGSLGVPDLGITTLDDVLTDVRRITDACSLPLLVDADTGFGSAFNIARTVKSLIKFGAGAMHIEDQVQAKRCGHRPGKEIVSRDEMVDRIIQERREWHVDGDQRRQLRCEAADQAGVEVKFGLINQ